MSGQVDTGQRLRRARAALPMAVWLLLLPTLPAWRVRSMHRVRTGNALERRAQRLSTPRIDDNRISFGCINVPVAFYEKYINPIFATSKAMVYVLPESKPLHEAFGMLQAQRK